MYPLRPCRPYTDHSSVQAYLFSPSQYLCKVLGLFVGRLRSRKDWLASRQHGLAIYSTSPILLQASRPMLYHIPNTAKFPFSEHKPEMIYGSTASTLNKKPLVVPKGFSPIGEELLESFPTFSTLSIHS